MPPSVFRGVPLPELTDDDHFKWVFTHRSVVTIPSSVRITEATTEDYERLALIGEFALNLCVMEFLYEACPLSRPSDLSDKKDAIVNKEKLAEWATGYGLHERIRAAPAQVVLIRNNPDVRASVFKAYIGAYWKQCIAESDRYDDGNIQGPYPNPVTALHTWLDGLIENEVIQLREADDLAERMRNTSLGGPLRGPVAVPMGGAMALLNEKAAQRKPPVTLEWEESEEGKPHKKTFNATLRVGGEVVGRGVGYSKKAARSDAAERAIGFLGWT